jgi:hypothetical protein
VADLKRSAKMETPVRSWTVLLNTLIGLDPHRSGDWAALRANAKALEQELEVDSSAIDPDDFHEIQHYIMACERPEKNAEWKMSLDQRMRCVLSKF